MCIAVFFIRILMFAVSPIQINDASNNTFESVSNKQRSHLHENTRQKGETNFLIKDGDIWYYYDSIMPKNEPWFYETNSDIRWKKGPSKFGYGNGDEGTVIQFGKKNSKYITSFFKKTIDLPPSDLQMIYLVNINVDDGAIIYLNGKEAYKINMPEKIIKMEIPALSRIYGDNENKYHLLVLDPDLFTTGKNTFAVSVHQYTKESSDCSFSMELIASNDPKFIYNYMQHKSVEKQSDFLTILNQGEQGYMDRLMDQEQEMSKIYLNKVIGIIGLFLIMISILIYMLNRKNKHTKKALLQSKEELNENQKELMNIGLLHLKKDRLLDELGDTIKDMIEKKKNQEQALQFLRKKISSYTVQNSNVEALQLHFENVHSEYFTKLKQNFPVLTTNDLRLCGYIRLQLTSKEIAELLSINHRSVQTIKYRLKKKLKIHKHIDLITFLSNYF